MKDYHLHTKLCKHAEGEMEQYVEAAIENGLSEICFTDHIPLPENFDPEHRMQIGELELYMNRIYECRSKYREISILSGIEADYIEGYEDYLEEFLKYFPFDLVIMSVHFIKKWGDKGWVFSYEYTADNIKEKYNDYFEALIKGVQTGLFDVVGHMDLIKRLNHPVLATNADDVNRALEAIKYAGMSVELNASGLRKHINDTYPSMDILKLINEKEIPIVLSSDAHKPEDVGFKFDELFNQLFTFPGLQLASYKQREGVVDGIVTQ